METSKKDIQVFCVRTDGGEFTKHFIDGGYIGIGWLPNKDLSSVKSREELYPLYKEEYPEDKSNFVISQQVGQVSRFLFDIQPGDYVITPDKNKEYIYYGVVTGDRYYKSDINDGCRYMHRRMVEWNKTPIQRSLFPMPLQYSLRSALTVFRICHTKEFLTTIGKPELAPEGVEKEEFDHHRSVLIRLLELDDKEFEQLMFKLLEAIGFEARHTGKVSDGGVDVTGVLDVNNLIKIELYVQVKRYKLDTKISANTVKALRSSIPIGAQGAFITTSVFNKKAYEVATDEKFNRIGLINGDQLVDILTEHWSKISETLKESLGLIGLVEN